MVLSGVVNKRLVNLLVAAGVPAVGISGEDGALIGARADRLPTTLGFVGRPVRIESRLIRTLLDGGFLPVISPVAYDVTSGTGGALNVNGDDAAAAIAVALEADELLLVADVEGVRDESGEIIAELDADVARDLIASGVAAGGMAAKLEAAHAALAGGVERVRISRPRRTRRRGARARSSLKPKASSHDRSLNADRGGDPSASPQPQSIAHPRYLQARADGVRARRRASS